MKLIKPCTYAPPGAPCPTHDNGTWPQECVCWQESQVASKLRWQRWLEIAVITTFYLGAISPVLFALLFYTIMARADERCLTRAQARAEWPQAYLRWKGADHCWYAPGKRRHHQPQPKPHIAPEPLVQNITWYTRPFDATEPLSPPVIVTEIDRRWPTNNVLPEVRTVHGDEFNELDEQAGQ